MTGEVDRIVREVREHQAQAPGREVCGFVLRDGDVLVLLRAENIAPTGDTAAPDARALREALTGTRALAFVYHTHLKDCIEDTDQPYCDAFGVPYLIVGPSETRVLQPTPLWESLIGREWKWGVTDCATLCFDFASLVHGLHPAVRPEWPREDGFEPAAGDDYFHRVHQAAGLVCVGPPWRFGDFLSFRIPTLRNRAPGENHLAVYLGDGRVLQVFEDGVSCENELDERLARYLAHGYRWVELEAAG